MIGSKTSAEQRLLEERLYAEVVRELSQGIRRDGLWAKAIANSNGTDELAKALYIQYRVQSLLDEMEVSEKKEQEYRKAKQAERNAEIAKERKEQARITRKKAITSVGKILFGTLAIIGVLGCFSGIFTIVTLTSEYGFTSLIMGATNFVIFGPLLYWSLKKLRQN